MNSEEKRAIAGLIRRLGRCIADRKAMITILGDHAAHNWPAELEVLRQTPNYDGALEVYESTALRLEQGAEIDEVNALMRQSTEGKLPN
jgi:hypothetical protein